MQRNLPQRTGPKVGNSGSHATFLDLDISISNGKISSKLYGKLEDFLFLIARMPNSHINIPSSIFYGTVFLCPRGFVLQDHLLLL